MNRKQAKNAISRGLDRRKLRFETRAIRGACSIVAHDPRRHMRIVMAQGATWAQAYARFMGLPGTREALWDARVQDGR